MSKIYEALKQAEQERAGQRGVASEFMSRLAAGQDALDVALGECRAQLAELRGRLEKFEAENGSANQRIDLTAESFFSTIGTLHGRLDDFGHQLEAGVRKAHENVGSLQGLVDTTIEDWNNRLAALVDEARSTLEGNAPAVEELRHGMARLRQLQAQSNDELHALVETARLRAGDATQRIDALGGRLQTQDELLRSLEKAHVAFEAVLSGFEAQVHEIAEHSHASAIEQEKLRNRMRDSNEGLAAQLRHVAVETEHRLQDIRQEIATFRQLVASTTSTLRASLDEHHGRTESVFQQFTTRIASGEEHAAEQLRKTLELATQFSAWSAAQERSSESAESLGADLERVRANAATSEAAIAALEQQIAELRTTVAATRDHAADQLKKALEPLAGRLSSRSTARERGAENAEGLRADLESIRASAATSEATIGALEQQIAELRTTVAATRDHAADQLRKALEPLARQLSSWSATRERDAESTERLQTDLESVQANAAESKATIGALQQQFASLRATVAAARGDAADELREALEPLAGQLSSWSATRERDAESAERLRTDLESVQANAAESKATIGALQQQFAELRATVAAAQDHAADQLKESLEPLAAQLSSWSAAQERDAESAERLRTDLESVQANAAESKATIGALQQQFAELRATVAAAQDHAADQLKESLAAQLLSWSAAQERGAESTERLRTDLESVQANTAESKATIGTLQQQFAELRATVAAAQDHAADQLKESLAAQLSSWSAAQERGAESAERLRSDLESVRAKATESTATIGALELQIAELRTTVAAARDNAADQLKNAMEPLAARLSTWSAAQERGGESVESLRTDLESLRTKAAESTDTIGALQQQIAELRTTVAATQDHAADQLKNAMEPLAARLSTWNAAQERGGESVESLRTDLEGLRTKAAESTDTIGALQQQIAELRKTVAAAQGHAAGQLKKALEPLGVQLSTWRSAQEQGIEGVETLRADVESLRTKAAESTANIGALEQQISELRAAARQDSADRRYAIGVDAHSRHDEEIMELRHALAARAQPAHETGSAHQRIVEAVGEVERVSEVAHLGAAVSGSRIETDIIPAARGQSLAPATRWREQAERWAATLRDDRGRRAWRVAAVVGCVLFGTMMLSRLMSAEKRDPNRADFGGEAGAATLRDPRVAPRLARGLNALRHGDFASAEKTFREVVAICPKCVEARNNLAVALDQEQKRDAAVEQLREAVRIRPDYRRALENLERLQGGIGAPSDDAEGLEGYSDG